jgi:hypothetical protein
MLSFNVATAISGTAVFGFLFEYDRCRPYTPPATEGTIVIVSLSLAGVASFAK